MDKYDAMQTVIEIGVGKELTKRQQKKIEEALRDILCKKLKKCRGAVITFELEEL